MDHAAWKNRELDGIASANHFGLPLEYSLHGINGVGDGLSYLM
jgi:hypothetical protein